jgi:hypothetical protein
MLNKNYKLTDERKGLTSAIAACGQAITPPSVGAYNDGLIMVVDSATGRLT